MNCCSKKIAWLLIWLIPSILASCDTPIAPEAPQPNHLAYIGGDGNVYLTTTADLQTAQALTTDAEVAAELQGLSYHRLSWSPDGWLAFASVQRDGDMAQSRLYVLPEPDGQPQLVGESAAHFVIYNYWSPQPCPGDSTCRQLAYLIEEEDNITLRLVTVREAGVTNEPIGAGWPFYYSWAPDGRSLLRHTGLDADAEITRYTVAANETDTLPMIPGGFMAPAWSPAGDGWLGVTRAGELIELQYFQGDEVTTITAVPGSSINFIWSPDGYQITYMVRAQDSDPFYGPIHLYDLHTGQTERLSDIGLRPVAFFWSPNGEQIAYLTWIPLGQDVLSQLRFFNIATRTDRGSVLFMPSPLMRFALSSFNQYAQSHRFWSADGRYFVYAAREGNNEDKIWVIDTWAAPGSPPIFIDDGSIGYWSW